MMDMLPYLALAVGFVILAFGLIGLALVAIWLAASILGSRRDARHGNRRVLPRVLD